jgi:hypothetical protein
MSVPGIGPIISSAMVAAIGIGDAFAKGRDFAAWLGLVPKQMSTGDRTILGKISKRGNRYLTPCGARKGPLDFRHLHLGFNRVGNETILMGGMMHLIELFRIGLSVAAPRNLWA